MNFKEKVLIFEDSDAQSSYDKMIESMFMVSRQMQKQANSFEQKLLLEKTCFEMERLAIETAFRIEQDKRKGHFCNKPDDPLDPDLICKIKETQRRINEANGGVNDSPKKD